MDGLPTRIIIVLLHVWQLSVEAKEVECSFLNTTSDYKCDSEESYFRCLNSSTTVSAKAVCNYIMDCPDLSDEMFCSPAFYTFKLKRYYEKSDDQMAGTTTRCEKHSRYRIKYKSFPSLTAFEIDPSDPRKKYTYYYNTGNANASFCGKNDTDEICSDGTYIGRSYWQRCDCSFSYCFEGIPGGGYMKDPFMPRFKAVLVIGFLIGITAVIGNAAVVIVSVKTLRKNRLRFSSKQRLTKYFFFSLSISDVIVAINTVSISTRLLVYGSMRLNSDKFFWNQACIVFGVLSIAGSEQSVFTMVLIAIWRASGIIRPFSRIPLKPFMISLVICWMLSVLIAVVPLMNAFEDTFIKIMGQNDARMLNMVSFDDVESLNEIFQRYSVSDKSNRPTGSWARLNFFVKELFNITLTSRSGYYESRGVCGVDFFPEDNGNFVWFSFFMFIANAICFILIAIGYSVIGKNRSRSNILEEEAESRRLRWKIFIILATDFICWIPICTLAIANTLYRSLGDQRAFKDGSHTGFFDLAEASMITQFLLLPINSVLNPFIYSAAPEYLYAKIASIYRSMKDKYVAGSPRDSAVTRTSTIIGNTLSTVASCPENKRIRDTNLQNFAECQL